MGLKIEFKNLYSGYLTTLERVLLLVKQKERCVIKSIFIKNEDNTNELGIALKMVVAGTEMSFGPDIIKARHTAIIEQPLTFEGNAQITGSCDQNDKITVKINGVIEDL